MVAAGESTSTHELSTSKFSTPSSRSTVRKVRVQISSDSFSDNDVPSLEVLRPPQLQKRLINALKGWNTVHCVQVEIKCVCTS